MSELCQTFQSPYSLQKPPFCFTLPSLTFTDLSLSQWDFCGQILENIFFFLNLLVQKIFFDKNPNFSWFQLLSTKDDCIISLCLISVALQSLSFSHFITSSVWNKKQKKTRFGFQWKPYCYSSPSHLTREDFISCFNQTPAKCTNQVTLSNEHMGYLFRA